MDQHQADRGTYSVDCTEIGVVAVVGVVRGRRCIEEVAASALVVFPRRFRRSLIQSSLHPTSILLPFSMSMKLKSIAAAWPTDPFRPNLQLKNFLDALAAHPRLTPGAVRSAKALLDDDVRHKVGPLLCIRCAFSTRVHSTHCLKRRWSPRRFPDTTNGWFKDTKKVHRASGGRGGRSFSAFGDSVLCTSLGFVPSQRRGRARTACRGVVPD